MPAITMIITFYASYYSDNYFLLYSILSHVLKFFKIIIVTSY